MSIATCQMCGDFVDTDEDPAYIEEGRTIVCVCEQCRDDMPAFCDFLEARGMVKTLKEVEDEAQ